MAALRVVANDHRVITDPEAADRRRERLGPQQHPARMAGRGWGSGQVAGPIAVDRTGHMTVQVILFRVGLEREAAIDAPNLLVVEPRGCLLGGPKQVRTREGAHVSDSSLSSICAMRRMSMNARRSATLIVTLALTVAAIVVGSIPAAAKNQGGAPSASFARLNVGSGSYDGTAASGGVLTLSGTLAAGTYTDPFAAGGPLTIPYHSGAWMSAPVSSPFAFDELVASWNAATPDGTWIKTELQATGSGRTTKWYVLGIWASGDGTIHRTSVSAQGDADGFIAIDTFIRSKNAAPLTSYQLRVTLYRADGASATSTPSVRFIGAMTSAESNFAIPSAASGVARELDVPQFSQETHRGEFREDDGGGEAWCIK